MADKNKKTKKKNPKIVYILAGIVILAAAALCFAINMGSEAVSGEKMVFPELNYETSSKASFHVSGKNIFYCSKDGMQLLDHQGSTVWTDTYTMQQPVMIGNGDYVAVAEERGRLVKVYGPKGFLYDIPAEGPITTFAVNQNGYTAVIMEMSNTYLTNIYNSQGTVVSISSCPAEESIPVAIAISEDSSIYATSYIDTSMVTFKSNVVMRYVGKEMAATAESIDGMFTAFSGGDAIVGMLKFGKNNTLAAISDQEIILMDISADGCKEKLRTSPNGVMTAVDVSADGTVAWAVKKENGGHISAYYQTGKQAADFDTASEISYIKMYDNMMLAATSSQLISYDMSGAQNWSMASGGDTKQLLLYSAANEILIAGNNKMRVMRVKKGENVNENAAPDTDEGAVIVTEELTEATTAAPVTETTTETVTADTSDDQSDEEYYEDDDDEEYYEDDEEYYEDDDEEYYEDEGEEYYDEDEDYSYDEDYSDNEDEEQE